MKNYIWLLCLVLLTTLSGCELASGIFKAGFWSGILIVAVVVGLIIYLVGRAGKK